MDIPRSHGCWVGYSDIQLMCSNHLEEVEETVALEEIPSFKNKSEIDSMDDEDIKNVTYDR